MSKATVCDNCQTVASSFTDEDPNDSWLIVGWFRGPRYEVCSATCAGAILGRLAKIAEVEAAEDAAATS